jgi:catechol 2,3-dioxygenase-like lactoylglutathione lyase family enzyme
MTSTKTINVVRLTAVHYQHPDLEKAKSFFDDFGFVEAQKDESRIYFRGFGIEPYIYVAEQGPTAKRSFVRGIWTVASYEDLCTAADHPAAITAIEQDNSPGGGQTVTLRDPNGISISFIYGQTLREKNGTAVSRNINNAEVNPNLAFDKHRRGQNRRFNQGPCPVHKIGHYGFGVPAHKFDETLSWYTSVMNLKLTDAVFQPTTGKDVTSFFHIDLGMEFSDHHVSLGVLPNMYIILVYAFLSLCVHTTNTVEPA